MFEPGQVANPEGRSGNNNPTQQLRKALAKAAKDHKTTIYKELAALFFTSDKWKLALLPYIVPRLRTLEVSGEVQVPFQFIIERSSGDTVTLPQPRKEIESNVISKVMAAQGRAERTKSRLLSPTKQVSSKVVGIAKVKRTKAKPKPTTRKDTR